MRNTHTLAYAIIYYVAKIRCVSAPRARRKKRKSTPCGVRFLSCYLVHTAIGGILAGEQMVRQISTVSVISRNDIASAKQVRECGARVGYIEIISRSVCSYISALPQYLERDARGMRTPCAAQIFPKTANKVSAQVGSVLCGAQIKRNKHPLWSA